MTGSLRLMPFWRRALLLALGIACVYAAMIPLAPGTGQVPPDLLYCLVVAWALRDPGSAAVWIVLPLGLFADVMLSRPIGLGALGLFLAAEVARSNARHLRGAPFLLEWLAATAGFALLLTATEAALRLTFAESPGPGQNARYLLATALAYPLIALAIVRGIGLRRPGSTPARALPRGLS